MDSIDGINRSWTVRHRVFKRTLGIAFVVLMAVSLLTTGCSPGRLQAQPPVTVRDQVWVDFTRPSGEVEATFYVWPRSSTDGLTEILVYFPYVENVGYHLDAFTLDVTAEGSIQPSIMMEATPYSWETMTFRRIDESVRLQVLNTGNTGDGTINVTLFVPDELVVERDLVFVATLRTKTGEASGEIRLAKRNSFR
jgi:hypothetical protein